MCINKPIITILNFFEVIMLKNTKDFNIITIKYENYNWIWQLFWSSVSDLANHYKCQGHTSQQPFQGEKVKVSKMCKMKQLTILYTCRSMPYINLIQIRKHSSFLGYDFNQTGLTFTYLLCAEALRDPNPRKKAICP